MSLPETVTARRPRPVARSRPGGGRCGWRDGSSPAGRRPARPGRPARARRVRLNFRAAVHSSMRVRDAVEADADRLAARADLPAEALRQLVHDRTVRVAEPDDDGDLLGFLAFDADESCVHVTQLRGEPGAVDRLLEEPVRFAGREGMAVEITVPESDERVREAVESAGFEEAGDGPRFDGEPTRRYRLQGKNSSV